MTVCRCLFRLCVSISLDFTKVKLHSSGYTWYLFSSREQEQGHAFVNGLGHMDIQEHRDYIRMFFHYFLLINMCSYLFISGILVLVIINFIKKLSNECMVSFFVSNS